MRILEVNKFNFIQGGADRHFLDVIDLLRSRGNEVAEFSMANPKNRYSEWNKYFVSYVGYSRSDSLWSKIKGSVTRLYSFEAKRKISQILDDFQPDIVHVHNIYHQISPSILPEIKKREIPIVMTVHDNKLVYPHYLPSSKTERIGNFDFANYVMKKEFKGSFMKSLLTALEFKIYKHFNAFDKYIDLYISPSNFTRSKLVQGGISGEKITVLPHFVSFAGITGFAPESKVRDYFLYSGRISREKGVEKLINIFQDIPEASLYLAGKIEDGLKIPAAKNIKYLGFLESQKLKDFIQNSRAVVSASELLETFGLIVTEANFYGKPFIGLENGAYRDIVKDYENGFLAKNEKEFGDVVRKIIDGKVTFDSQKITKNVLNKYTPERYYLKFRDLLESLT